MEKIGVAVVGDVLDINCWSSTPYFFFSAGAKDGIFHMPWQANVNKIKVNRYLWNIKQFLCHGEVGGFQYSPYFLDLLESQIPDSYFSSTVITFNQLFPRASSVKKQGGKIYYYLDATLYDLFNSSTYAIRVSDRIKQKAIELEKDNYAKSEAVVTMGKWVHQTLQDIYHLPSHKLHHILPGANFILPPDFQLSKSANNNRLTLGFVGKDWKRKGLLLLREVQQVLLAKGYNVVIKIIGNCPDELQQSENIHYCGFINKQTDTEKFTHEIASCDIGCLFSADEALGISVLEFLRVGVPVAGFYHQGMKDTLLEGASFRFTPDTSAEMIAQTFEQYIVDDNLRNTMRQKAIAYSSYVTWERCVKEWKLLLQANHAVPEG